MKEPKVINGTKVIFGPVRLSYVHLFQKSGFKGGEEKYSTSILIPQSEKKTIQVIQEAIEAAKNSDAAIKKWGGKIPRALANPLRDGDDKEDEVYHDHYYLTAKCNTRPGVIDAKTKQPITNEEEIYSGVWAYVSVNFFPYDAAGNRGIACGLNNVAKFRDDDFLGGRASAENDFADFAEDEDDL